MDYLHEALGSIQPARQSHSLNGARSPDMTSVASRLDNSPVVVGFYKKEGPPLQSAPVCRDH